MAKKKKGVAQWRIEQSTSNRHAKQHQAWRRHGARKSANIGNENISNSNQCVAAKAANHGGIVCEAASGGAVAWRKRMRRNLSAERNQMTALRQKSQGDRIYSNSNRQAVINISCISNESSYNETSVA